MSLFLLFLMYFENECLIKSTCVKPLKPISYHYISSHLLISSYHCWVIVLVTNIPLLNLLPTLNNVLFYSILFYSILFYSKRSHLTTCTCPTNLYWNSQSQHPRNGKQLIYYPVLSLHFPLHMYGKNNCIPSAPF